MRSIQDFFRAIYRFLLYVYNACSRRQPEARVQPAPTPIFQIPQFAMRHRTLPHQKITGSSDEVKHYLKRDYHLALLKASIKSLGAKVVEIGPHSKTPPKNQLREYIYVRDPALILHDMKIIITTTANTRYGSIDMTKKLKKLLGYQIINIDNAYFEGGNVIYLPHEKVILHGLDPVGHYPADESIEYLKSDYGRKNYFKVDPELTNMELDKQLSKFGITTRGLSLNPTIIYKDHGTEASPHRGYYYHLDCFMQLLPDGRLIILNKNILSRESQDLLFTFFGDKLIDLAYPDFLEKPIFLNFITIPYKNNFAIVAPQLPEIVIQALIKSNLKVITPDTLDPRSKYYEREFAEKVVYELAKEGFNGMDAKNLATHLPKNLKGYRLDNSEHLSEIKLHEEELDSYYSESPISFVHGRGGPHCLTSEITPSEAPKPLIPAQKKQYVFFHYPKKNQEKEHKKINKFPTSNLT